MHVIIIFKFLNCSKIINPEPIFFDERTSADVRFDCGGALISPGFIDVQINGTLFLLAELYGFPAHFGDVEKSSLQVGLVLISLRMMII